MSLRDRDGLGQLLACLRARAEAIADPPPLPPEFGDLHEWREWLHDGGDGFYNPDQPCTGFFRTRLVSGGPWVPMAIFQTDAGEWWAWVDDELWPMEGRLLYPRMITESKFLEMHNTRIAAAKRGDFDHYSLRPRTPIDMTDI